MTMPPSSVAKLRKKENGSFLLTLSYEKRAIIKQYDEIDISSMEELNHFGNYIEKVQTRPQSIKQNL